MTVLWRKSFKKDYRKLSREQKKAWLKSWGIFKHNQRYMKLRRHKLKGKYEGLESIDITPDLRVLFIQTGDQYNFYYIRNHNQLYS